MLLLTRLTAAVLTERLFQKPVWRKTWRKGPSISDNFFDAADPPRETIVARNSERANDTPLVGSRLACSIKATTMKSVVRQVRFLVYPMEIVSASPFRLHRRIGPRPALPGVDATVKVEGAAPFCRARAEVRRPLASTFPRHGRYSWVNHISSVCFVFAEPLADLRHAHRYRRVLVSVERTIFKGMWAKRFD